MALLLSWLRIALSHRPSVRSHRRNFWNPWIWNGESVRNFLTLCCCFVVVIVVVVAAQVIVVIVLLCVLIVETSGIHGYGTENQ